MNELYRVLEEHPEKTVEMIKVLNNAGLNEFSKIIEDDLTKRSGTIPVELFLDDEEVDSAIYKIACDEPRYRCKDFIEELSPSQWSEFKKMVRESIVEDDDIRNIMVENIADVMRNHYPDFVEKIASPDMER